MTRQGLRPHCPIELPVINGSFVPVLSNRVTTCGYWGLKCVQCTKNQMLFNEFQLKWPLVAGGYPVGQHSLGSQRLNQFALSS